MCISPISIKNPNYGLKPFPGRDISHQMIRVPCGHCSECIANKQMQLVQRIQMEEMHYHLFFCTLTYCNEMLPVVSVSTGYDIRFADIRDVQNMIKRIRISNSFGRPFRYFAVSELGSKRGRPHFHIIFSVLKDKSDDFNTCLSLEKKLFNIVLSEWRRNIGSKRKPVYKELCHYKRIYTRQGVKTNYDLHYINARLSVNGSSDVGFYVLKYMMKPSDRAIRLQQALRLNLPVDEYESVWSLVRPRYFKSLHFGDDVFIDSVPVTFDVEKYVSDSIAKSDKNDYPKFINPHDGSFYPLARYYKTRFLTPGQLSMFHPPVREPLENDKHISQLIKTINDYEKKSDLVTQRDYSADGVLFYP